MTGIIVKAIAGFYYVDTGDVVIECKARGKFRNKSQSPLVGDRVEITPTDGGKATVDKILPRKNSLIRPPLANLDLLFIIASVSDPQPNLFFIDKLSAYAEYNGVEPIIVANKPDLGSPEELLSIYKKAVYKTLCASGKTGEGVEALKARIAAFADSARQSTVCITNERHIRALELALDSACHAKTQTEPDCIATDVQEALHQIGTITGTDVDAEVIDRIFRNFCVGK